MRVWVWVRVWVRGDQDFTILIILSCSFHIPKKNDAIKRDYCILEKYVGEVQQTPPAPSNVLNLLFVGNNGIPSERFPLGLCEGDVSDLLIKW